jgi:hypothetical protein
VGGKRPLDTFMRYLDYRVSLMRHIKLNRKAKHREISDTGCACGKAFATRRKLFGHIVGIRWYRNHRAQARAASQRWKDRDVPEVNRRRRERKAAEYHYALIRYSGADPPSCRCCGCTDEWALTIGHINDDGAEHRKRIAGRKDGRQRLGLTSFLRYLRRNNWPDDPPLETVCWNCQWGKRRNSGICPHQRRAGPS